MIYQRREALERRRHEARLRRDAMAGMVAEGYSVAAAGRVLGVSQQRSSQIWTQIKRGLGWQAV